MNLKELAAEYWSNCEICKKRYAEMKALVEKETNETRRLQLRRRLIALEVTIAELATTAAYLEHYYDK